MSRSGCAILLEIVRCAGSMQVRAVDERDGLEISFVAAATTARADLERLAASKLAYVRTKADGRLRTDTATRASGRSDAAGLIV